MSLILVPTPIGNLADITLRALETLKQVDVILCEDTRTSSVLLKYYGIQKPLWSYHQHNEHKAIDNIIHHLREGKHIALITDAGTPAISDPGYLIVRACIEHGIDVNCLPGATAFVPALVQSGFVSNSFVFEGFLPLKKGRKTKLEQLGEEPRTSIIYESPHRIEKTIAEFIQYFGAERKIAICRELSKKFEETILGELADVLTKIQKHPVKGEIVVVIEGVEEYERRKRQNKNSDALLS
jgi:16S rRNA (cytidine1402-2'-O)-methyltransferase